MGRELYITKEMYIEGNSNLTIFMGNQYIKGKMVRHMMENGKITKKMDMDNINGLMAVHIKAIIQKTKDMARGI